MVIKNLGDAETADVKLVEKNGVHYAMKVLKKKHPRYMESFLARYRSEFDLVSQLNVDSAIEYYEFLEEVEWRGKNGCNSVEKCYCLVMELVEGFDLINYFNLALIQDERLLRCIFRKMIDALSELHYAGIAHRDIKPDNIMITVDYKIKIVDFEHAHDVREEDWLKKIYGEGTTVGSLAYKAPEAHKHADYDSMKIDIFSLGVSFLTLYTMSHPFYNGPEGLNYQIFHVMPEIFWKKFDKFNIS